MLAAGLLGTACKSNKAATASADNNPKKSGELSSQQQAEFAYKFVEGCKERMRGNIEIAENLFMECLKIDPASGAAKYELGNVYRFNGMYDMALKYAKECAAEDPKNEWYQLLYIECLHNKRQYAQAADVYSKLIKNFPQRPDFYEGLAAEYMYGGSYEKSYKTYDELEKKFGANETFTLNKIKLLRQLKKNTEAEQEFRKLIAQNPSEARYYTYLAEFYQENDQNEKAFQTYQEILKIAPDNPMVHLALADYYKLQNDRENFFKEVKAAFENPDLEIDIKLKILSSYYDISENNEDLKKQAYELCELMLKVNPEASESHGIYADFLLRDKKTDEAAKEYELALKADKSQYRIWNQLMQLELELNRFEALEAHSAESIDLFPNQPNPYFFNGISNLQLKNYSKATESLKDGIEFVFNNRPLLIAFYSALGDAYNSNNEFDKSDKAFDEALKVDPDNAQVLNNYAYYLSLRKTQLDKAEKYSRRSNELAPNTRAYMDTYGWILYQLGKYADAESWLSKAMKAGAKDPDVLEHYGDVLFKLGRKDEAITYWKEAKNHGGNSDILNKKLADQKLYE